MLGGNEMKKRAALYLRVSTARQAEHDLSIPDQRRRAEEYCAAHDWQVVAVHEERGASGRTDQRPEFQRMIEEACSRGRPYDAIVVHSLSRFARNALDVAVREHQLEKNGVALVSITQEFTDDANGKLLRQIVAAVDEKQSADNAVHTLRSMEENARLGFWNGSQPPFGYQTVVTEQRGDKAKKRLQIEPREAEIVRLIFGLYVQGDGRSGPMGLKKVASYLNERGMTTRQGRRFRIQFTHNILTNSAYVGAYFFNRNDSRTRKPKPREEWIEVPVPPVVDDTMFAAAQDQLKARNPKMNPPRRTTNPVLLSGVAHCGHCGSAMRMRTGKGGKYRYYTCGRKADQGKTACKGRTIPEGTLDDLVLDAFEDRILQPDRLKNVLGSLVARASQNRETQQLKLKELRTERREIEKKIERLFEAIENGTVDVDGMLRKRLSGHQSRCQELVRLCSMTERRINAPIEQITPDQIDGFARALRKRLRDGAPAFRKTYLRQFIDHIEVGEREIRISGPKAMLLEQASAGVDSPVPAVRTFEQVWCAREDSNSQPPDP
jgi:site-specific DNA recombinase